VNIFKEDIVANFKPHSPYLGFISQDKLLDFCRLTNAIIMVKLKGCDGSACISRGKTGTMTLQNG
jgi:hypothetical protein